MKVPSRGLFDPSLTSVSVDRVGDLLPPAVGKVHVVGSGGGLAVAVLVLAIVVVAVIVLDGPLKLEEH